MNQAAVPDYFRGQDFSDAPPGHRFTLYFEGWNTEWTLDKEGKTAAIKKVASPLAGTNANPGSRQQLDALLMRQAALAEQLRSTGTPLETFHAKSTAPFATGLGMEHPLENGFAFLNPYGLPYLPGSGVKGVLRAAARELVSGEWGGTAGWDAAVIEHLFGSLPGAEPLERGALTFWDVIPKIERMAVDVMTPHQGEYYSGKQSPHDSGQPIPIPFLVIPPGVPFAFHVLCDEKRLPEALKGGWRKLMQGAFTHAFDWLGFGAKTAVGYGAMQEDPAVREQKRKAAEARAAQAAAEATARELAAAEQARQQADAARRAAEQQAFDALSASQRLLYVAKAKLDTASGALEISRAPQVQALQAAIKPIAEEASGWSQADDREAAAQLLEQSYELIGWFIKGVDKDKRKKQEAKKRTLIAAIRTGTPTT